MLRLQEATFRRALFLPAAAGKRQSEHFALLAVVRLSPFRNFRNPNIQKSLNPK
jgi:hypothetical protein